MEYHKGEHKDGYPGLVESIESDLVDCSILVGAVELRIPFAREDFYQNPIVGDKFDWSPTESGEVKPKCFKILSRGNEPILTEDDLKRLENLDFSKYMTPEQRRENYRIYHPIKSKLLDFWPFSYFIKKPF